MTYPILRFKDAPKVTVGIVYPGGLRHQHPRRRHVVQAGNTAAFNAGWAPPAPASRRRRRSAGAVANAFFDATGVRIREAPMTPARVRGVLSAAGIK